MISDIKFNLVFDITMEFLKKLKQELPHNSVTPLIVITKDPHSIMEILSHSSLFMHIQSRKEILSAIQMFTSRWMHNENVVPVHLESDSAVNEHGWNCSVLRMNSERKQKLKHMFYLLGTS